MPGAGFGPLDESDCPRALPSCDLSTKKHGDQHVAGQRGALLERGCSTALGAALDLAGLPGGQVIHQSLPLRQQWPCFVFSSCILGSPSDVWGYCSSEAGTLDTLVDPGNINLFMQVVLRDALLLMVTELSLYRISLASFSLFSYFFTLPGAISLPCAFSFCISPSGFGFGFGVNLCSSSR